MDDALGHTSLLMRSKVTSSVPPAPLLVYPNVHTINYCGNAYVYMRLFVFVYLCIHNGKYSLIQIEPTNVSKIGGDPHVSALVGLGICSEP